MRVKKCKFKIKEKQDDGYLVICGCIIFIVINVYLYISKEYEFKGILIGNLFSLEVFLLLCVGDCLCLDKELILG